MELAATSEGLRAPGLVWAKPAFPAGKRACAVPGAPSRRPALIEIAASGADASLPSAPPPGDGWPPCPCCRWRGDRCQNLLGFATRFPEATWHRPTECPAQQWDVVEPSKGGIQDGAMWTQPGCVLFSRDPRASRAVIAS